MRQGWIVRLVQAAIGLLGLIFAANAAFAGTDSRAEWRALTGQAIQAFRRGEGEIAVSLATRALDVARAAFGSRDLYTLASMNTLAEVLESRGRYGEAEPLFREALELKRQVLGPRDPSTLLSMNGLAGVLEAEGRYGEAESLYRETLDLRREVLGPKDPQTQHSVANLAGVLERQGRYGEAERQFREALDLSRQTPDPDDPGAVTLINDLATVLLDQGQYEAAEKLSRETLDLRRQMLGPEHPYTLGAMNNLAFVLDSEGRSDEAEPLFREALELERQVLGLKHPSTINGIENLARVLESQGRFGEAERLFSDAFKLRQQTVGARHPDTFICEADLARTKARQGLYGEAEPLFRNALDELRNVLPEHPVTLNSQLNLTFVLAMQGRVTDAIDLHRQMEPLILDRLGIELYTTQTATVRREMVASQSTYQDVALTLAQLPDAGAAGSEVAASALLRFKGLAVEEEAYLAHLARQGEDEHIRAVATELQALHAQMARLTQAGPTEMGQEPLSSQQMADLTARLEAKQIELGGLSRNYATSLQVRKANVQDLRNHLPGQSAFLDIRLYHRFDLKAVISGPARFAGVLITSTGDIVVRDLGPVDEADANVHLLLSGSPEAAETASKTLYEELLTPFAAELSGLERLYVAPDGSLNLVSFGLLRGPDGQRVMDRLDVRLVQTGRDLLRPAADKPAKGLVAIGGIDFDLALPNAKPDATPATPIAQADAIVEPIKRTRGDTLDSLRNGFGALKHSKEEVETVADLYGDARPDEEVPVVAEGATPTKDWLLGLSPPRVLHLATHGFYRAPKQPSDQPMLLSGIALAGANRSLKDGGDGGILYALEAQDLNLEGTELVVLSACQTALGQYDYGDGVSGLVRALRVAGARNVLVTLRSVDDEQTAKFMQRFYFHWLNQKQSDPAAALRDAQAEYVNSPDAGTTWTSFIIVGG
jgi:CHAT domain-containing protein/tetratricopeptide (TPR) repeat protein